MAARVSYVNGCAIYDLASGAAVPAWLPAAKKRALKRSGDYARRVELIQDFRFPEAARSISVSPDGRFVVATGTYAPRVRVWDTAELSLKFERYMDATPLAHAVISPDYAKLAFLQEDRGVELHAAYGRHYRTRIPEAGRDLAWHAPSAELLIACSAPRVHRLSLEEGRFLAPLELGGGPGAAANRVAVSSTTALIGAACDGGAVELWDPRARARAGRLVVRGAAGGECDATALAFEEGGLGLAVGTSDARALVYDLRAAAPVATKEHPYALPLVSVAFHRSPARLVLSADAKQVKAWRRDDGAALTNVEMPARLNAVAVASDAPGTVGAADSGLLFFAAEAERVGVAYVPALGPAPRWAAFVDALTEEVDGYAGAGAGAGGAGAGAAAAAAAAAPGSVYDDYKFLTREELAALGLGGLVGTPLVRAYLHGFFIDARLHRRVMAAAPPAAAGALRAERVAAALAATRAPRLDLAPAGGAPRVNAALAARLGAEAAEAAAAAAEGRAPARQKGARRGSRPRADDDEEAADAAARGAGAAAAAAAAGAPPPAPAPSLLADARFAALFSNPEFAIEEEEAGAAAARRGAAGAKGGGGGLKRGRAGGV